jgi:hypothetical protein
MQQMTIQVSALLAKGDEVAWVQFQLRRQVKRADMMDLDMDGIPAPLASRLALEVLTLHVVPLWTSQVCGLAVCDVMN